ncbi:MAG TPA: class I SAM-dependent methyltransferase [Gemmatimonadales bacterium]|nr:class I SAM-dependent methyltransferase [Gemmatimonadales bacterium]
MTATLKPVSQTAYYCCGVRALDATAARPVCGDQYAERFMTSEGWALFEPFRGLRAPNACNIARHRIIDDLLRARLTHRPETGVVIIGAGFDTRAFRLPGGRWVEVDEPALIAVKEARLPAREAPNPLTRVAITFDRERLQQSLLPFRHLADPVVVLEGILTYLSLGEVQETLRAIRTTFTHPTVVCDLTTPTFARRYAGKIGDRLRQLGAPYGSLGADPLELILAAGFRLTMRQSIVARAAELGMLRTPRWLLATVLRSLRDGYTIATFEPA